ncbi:hypothetical protein CANINC_003550 [Pichia inconspicua]|uniref:Uncharacterized protein n=1 Tax=Pichia inconspicua TaxID=52247 RepID=A0A4T0WZS7_9ASCO|nr:hypothetical protein CANINC_003550 [[Candida] inconspicua]
MTEFKSRKELEVVAAQLASSPELQRETAKKIDGVVVITVVKKKGGDEKEKDVWVLDAREGKASLKRGGGEVEEKAEVKPVVSVTSDDASYHDIPINDKIVFRVLSYSEPPSVSDVELNWVKHQSSNPKKKFIRYWCRACSCPNCQVAKKKFDANKKDGKKVKAGAVHAMEVDGCEYVECYDDYLHDFNNNETMKVDVNMLGLYEPTNIDAGDELSLEEVAAIESLANPNRGPRV